MSSPIAGIPGLPSLPKLAPIGGGAAPDAAGAADFAKMVGNGLQNLEQTQATADNFATQAATGQLTDLHDFTVASAQASIATELAVSVRNKGVEAFNEIMRMQV